MKRILASLAISALAVGAVPLIHTQAASANGITYRHVCAPATLPDQVTCFALQRTDLPALGADVAPAAIAGYHPSDLLSAYNLASAVSGGSGQVLADVLWNDDPYLESNLNTYRKAFGLPPCTTANGCFKKVNQYGQAAPLPPTNSGVAGEYALDVDMFSAICPTCKILIVEANQATQTSINIAEDTAVRLGATVVSNSYGGSEVPSDTSYDVHYNHPGVAITVSSGDSAYQAGAQYPAASPYVTAVGGTSLSRAANSRGWTESAWFTSYIEGAGSGCSRYDAKPSWQHDTSCSRRTIADVAAVADPATGVSVYDTFSGGWAVYGGTSVAAPIVAGVYALAGNASSVTYGSYPYSHTSALYDVTTGKNGYCGSSYLCTAKPGYDGPTGFGTPNGTGAF